MHLSPPDAKSSPRPFDLRLAAKHAPMLDAKSEHELTVRAQAGDTEAMRSLVLAHLRLVVAAAQPYVGGTITLEDLIGEGCLGLMEAASRFDPERGNRFSTYAIWWVRAHLRRYTLANRRIVGSPSTRNARRVLGSITKAKRDITQQLGRPPTRDEVAKALDVEPSDVAMVESSLSVRDLPLGPVDEGVAHEVASFEPSPEEIAADNQRRAEDASAVAQAMRELSHREREIVTHRLIDDDRTSLATLGERFGVSRERVRQIQQRAQLKLRTVLIEKVA